MATRKKDFVRYKEIRRADLLNDQKSAPEIEAADNFATTQEEYQEFILSQIKRIIHGDAAGLWKDDFVGQGIPSLASAADGTFVADCLATDLPYAAVSMTGPSVGGVAQVTTIDISLDGCPSPVGLIQQKLSTTRCIVQTQGTLYCVSGLIPSATYFVGFDGQPALTPLPASPTGLAYIQSVGIALDTNALRISINPGSRFKRSG